MKAIPNPEDSISGISVTFIDPYDESTIPEEGFKVLQSELNKLGSESKYSSTATVIADTVVDTSSVTKTFFTLFSLCEKISKMKEFYLPSGDRRFRLLYDGIYRELELLRYQLFGAGIDVPELFFETPEKKEARLEMQLHCDKNKAQNDFLNAQNGYVVALSKANDNERILKRILLSDADLKIDGLTYQEQLSVIYVSLNTIPRFRADAERYKARMEEAARLLKIAEETLRKKW